MRDRIEVIENALDNGSYKPGPWQALISDLDRLAPADRQQWRDDVSRVSRKLHGRHGFPRFPFLPALVLELIVFSGALWLLSADSLVPDLLGVALLALTLQPLMKISAGLLLGIRYDYAFLWYFEPRFKMAYGSYLCLGGLARVILHLAGSVGTPLALWVGYLQLTPHLAWLGWLALAGCVATALMQVGAFVAEWLGVRMVGPFRLSQLTSPATAAYEIKRLMAP